MFYFDGLCIILAIVTVTALYTRIFSCACCSSAERLIFSQWCSVFFLQEINTRWLCPGLKTLFKDTPQEVLTDTPET